MSQLLHPLQNPFVGRKHEQELYQHLLTVDSPWLLMITAQGGNGKSTLLRHLATQTPRNIPVVLLNFAIDALRVDPLKILEELSWKINRACAPASVQNFKQTLYESRARLSELNRHMSQVINVGSEGSLEGANLSMSSSDAVHLRQQQLQVRATVTDAFYNQLLTFSPERLVLMLDTCEWLTEPEGLEVGKWVMDEFVPGMHERMAYQEHSCTVVLASRMPLSLSDEMQGYYPLSLPMLEPSAVEDYLTTIGMRDATLRQRVCEITHGHPLCVSILGTLWQEQGDSPFTLADLPQFQQQFSERALLTFIQERLDKRLKSPFKELTRYGVLLRSFNLPLLQAVFPELLPQSESASLDLFRDTPALPLH